MSATTCSSWESKAHEKRTNILSTLPQEPLHFHLSHLTTDTSSIQDIKTISSHHQKRNNIPIRQRPPLTYRQRPIHQRASPSIYPPRDKSPAPEPLHGISICFSINQSRKTRSVFFNSSEEKTEGPLHGLPISVKDQCRAIGTETNCGFVDLGKRDTEDSLLAEILQNAGAVVFVKTSLSVRCMWGETVNKSVLVSICK